MQKADVPEFIKILNPNGKEEKIYGAAEARASYCEIVWEWIDDSHNSIRGLFVSDTKRDNLRNKLK